MKYVGLGLDFVTYSIEILLLQILSYLIHYMRYGRYMWHFLCGLQLIHFFFFGGNNQHILLSAHLYPFIGSTWTFCHQYNWASFAQTLAITTCLCEMPSRILVGTLTVLMEVLCSHFIQWCIYVNNVFLCVKICLVSSCLMFSFFG